MHGFDYSVPLFSTRVRGMRIVVTPQLVEDVLHVPKVEHPDYPGCERLRTMSKDEMISAFYECPSNQGDHQFTPCKAFAKGPRFINMVMTLSCTHSLTITLSQSLVLNFCFLCQSISLQIFLHILFFLLQMCIGIRLPMISSFSLQLSRRFYTIFPFLFPLSTIFLSCVPQMPLPLNVARHSLGHGKRIQQLLPPLRLHLNLFHPHPLPPLLQTMFH